MFQLYREIVCGMGYRLFCLAGLAYRFSGYELQSSLYAQVQAKCVVIPHSMKTFSPLSLTPPSFSFFLLGLECCNVPLNSSSPLYVSEGLETISLGLS